MRAVYTPAMTTLRAALAALLLGVAANASAAADFGPSGLAPEWSIEGAPPGRVRVAGYVYNHNNVLDAANVWLRVDELSADGAVSAAHQRRLFGDVRARGRMAFDVPVSGGAASYRVVVESVDWLLECR